MKKLFLIFIQIFASLSFATQYNWEVNPTVGLNLLQDSDVLNKSLVFGTGIQYNGFTSKIKPELQYLYTKSDFIRANIDTSISRITLQGVYDFNPIGKTIPLLKAGIGSENRSKEGNNPFINVAVGMKIPHTKQLALKLEAVYIFNNTTDNQNSLVFLAGINYSFGQRAKKSLTTYAPIIAEPLIIKEKPKEVKHKSLKRSTPIIQNLDPTEKKMIKTKELVVQNPHKDDDNDGILNSLDKCPNTALGKLVYSNGCPESLNLDINFNNNTADISKGSYERIRSFAKFLKQNPNYSTDIIAYAKTQLNEENNLKLAKKRAIAVQTVITQEGISTSKVRAYGRNATAIFDKNNSKSHPSSINNNRIEAEIIKHK